MRIQDCLLTESALIGGMWDQLEIQISLIFFFCLGRQEAQL